MSELKKYKLGDLGFFFGGVTTISKEDYGHGTPFLPYKNVYKNSKVNVNELELMNIRTQDIEKRSAKYGDIFFTASSETPDEVAMSSVLLDDVVNLTYNGFCKRYRLNDFNTLLPEYARYLFRDINFRREVYQVATGDIRFNISQESLANIEIEIPDVTIQAQLAEILMTLDDKIELNLQMNQTLEAMAQALFKEWFVNFNFPNFDGVLENGLPKGWRTEKLATVCDVKYGKDHKHLGVGNIPVYGSGGIMRFADKALYEKESILIPRKGTLTNLFYVSKPFWSVDTMFYTIIKDDAIRKYLFYLLKTLNLASMNVGSAVPSLTTEVLNKIDIIIPENSTLVEFEKITSSFYSKMEVNKNQIDHLIQTRETLLPKLMSGCLNLDLLD
jgi:type I restriction enzyme, S subunit